MVFLGREVCGVSAWEIVVDLLAEDLGDDVFSSRVDEVGDLVDTVVVDDVSEVGVLGEDDFGGEGLEDHGGDWLVEGELGFRRLLDGLVVFAHVSFDEYRNDRPVQELNDNEEKVNTS